ncbi:MAG: hypothetical protein AAGH73_10320, partial [Pseudomonadota bacterium]
GLQPTETNDMELMKKLALICWAFRLMALAIALVYGGAFAGVVAMEIANNITCGCVAAVVSRELEGRVPG